MTNPVRIRDLVIDMAAVNPDPAYVAWARHLERCADSVEAGELDPQRLCWWGRILLQAWLAHELGDDHAA